VRHASCISRAISGRDASHPGCFERHVARGNRPRAFVVLLNMGHAGPSTGSRCAAGIRSEQVESDVMKRAMVLVAIFALLALPAAVLAQGDYPMGGGSSGGGITVGGGSSGGGGDQEAAGEGEVNIVDFAFQPSAIFVHPGDTVSWYNTADENHTVTSNSGAFDSGVIHPGGEYSVTFDTGGVYSYHCEIHPNMRGMVVVLGM
jgi:plastocyanin